MPLLQTKNLTISIASTRVCTDLNITIEAGEIWAVLGRNGIGKTTLLHTLARLHQPLSGEIFIADNNIQKMNRKQIAQKMGLLLQHHEDAFPSTILETVLIGRHPYISQWQWESQQDQDIAMDALKQVDLHRLAQRQINQLSGGERQRVAIATLLTQNPDILLLDEPNSHLDLNYQISILDHICQHAKQNHHTVIMSLHDINLAARFCDHVLLLSGEGENQHGLTDEILQEELLEKTYQHPISIINSNNSRIFLPK
ncbi:MAG: ABC transporter ATP-binding protein [Gammaproteobacteria bacterium]|nr:ABC transporter ATP-binding protein [Gammaproteobacteria bacterium]